MAEHGFVGRHGRDSVSKYRLQGLEFNFIPHFGGGCMGVDRLDIMRQDACVVNTLGDAACDRFQVGGNEMVGVGSHTPTGDFHPVIEAVRIGEFPACNQDATGPL